MWQRRGLQSNVTTKSRGRSRLWPNGLQKNEEAGYGQVDRKTTRLQGVCVFYYCRTYYKAVRVGGGGEWRTGAMRDDEPRPVWMSLLITHGGLSLVLQ
jgi:hypothetical protein